MQLINIFLTEMTGANYSPVLLEIAKVVLVTVGWVGGLAAFVYWKEKHNNIAV